MASFLRSREIVMQGGPLAMIAYRIGILPISKNLKQDIPDITQPWYADNNRGLVTFSRIDTYFNSLTRQGSGCRYYPELSKSVLIEHPENLKDGKVFGARHGFNLCMGAHYFWGYIGDDESKSNCLREHTLTW